MQDKEQSKPETIPQLDPSRFHLAEAERMPYAITVEQGVTKRHITDPAFLAHVAARLRPYDKIEVRCDDGSFYAELLVLTAERTYARVHLLAWHDLTTKDVTQTQAAIAQPGYTVEWKGPHRKWCVIRTQDASIVHEQAPGKHEASVWLHEFLKVTA